MDALQFCYWLQGHFELNGPNLTPEQVKIVQDHLALVFNKVTPAYTIPLQPVPQEQKILITWDGTDKISRSYFGNTEIVPQFTSIEESKKFYALPDTSSWIGDGKGGFIPAFPEGSC